MVKVKHLLSRNTRPGSSLFRFTFRIWNIQRNYRDSTFVLSHSVASPISLSLISPIRHPFLSQRSEILRFSGFYCSVASMNYQQAGHPRSFVNGYGRRRVEKDAVPRAEHKSQSGKTNMSKLTTEGVALSKDGYGSPSYERLLYLSTCLIGHSVEVQVKDGSVFSGIFHSTNADKDLGIILKVAREMKTSSSQGQKSFLDTFSKAPSKTFIIPYKELVQITAKDVSVTIKDFENDLQHVKQPEIMLDSFISQHRNVDAERELEPWVPDEDDPQCSELDNIFDGPWNRGWDQFEANEALFGVKSTFDEDLYTTKLERGPQMRELERKATRIAREIEGEETQDQHLAEERGVHFPEHFDIDEETKYSSVFRGVVDDSGYDEDEDILFDSQNIETFGDASSSVLNKSFANFTSEKFSVGAEIPSCSSSVEEQQGSKASTAGDTHRFDSSDNSGHLSSQLLSDNSAMESKSRIQENRFNDRYAGSTCVEEFGEKIELTEEAQTLKPKDLPSSVTAKIDDTIIAGASPNYTSNPSTSQGSSKAQEKIISSSVGTGNGVAVKAQGATQSVKTRGRPGSAASSTSESGRIVSSPTGPALSPSSSVGSFSSEKSTLNPHAKEFKLNPNAKSFVPSQSPLRPASPVTDGSFYYPPNAHALPHMHGMPVGIGVGPSYSPQPVIYNPQVSLLQSPQGFFHPNGPQYGQQMILGQPRQVLYMPAYSPLD